MATHEELTKRREERQKKYDEDRKAQETLDLEAIDKLEAEGGAPLRTMTARRFVPGVPVRIAYRAPAPDEYKRYQAMVGRALTKKDVDAQRKAQEMLAEVCLVYPAEKTSERAALFDSAPGTLISLAIEAANVAELEAVDEGKD